MARHEGPERPRGQQPRVPGQHRSHPEPLITKEFGLDFKRQPLDAKKIGELNPEAVKLMDQAGFG